MYIESKFTIFRTKKIVANKSWATIMWTRALAVILAIAQAHIYS